MSSITDYLYRLQGLTNTNMKLLTAINDSFSTKNEHLSVMVDGTQYIIPSFIALENKIDQLEADFENMVSIPQTGEASLTFDGNTQRIKLMGYNTCPEEQHLTPVNSFKAEKTDIFKDFMTPAPYIKLNLSTLSDNATSVVVRKVALLNESLQGIVQTLQKEGSLSWSDMAHALYGFEEDKDYVQYDRIRRVPLKDNMCLGTYTVKKVVAQEVDDNFEEHYVLEMNEDLTYKIVNETIEKDIAVGDFLVTNDDKVKVVVEDVHPGNRTIKVKVLYGAYAEIKEYHTGDEKSKLRFFKHGTYVAYKYINVPLEEDRFVCVFVSAINDELNSQAPWGDGLFIDVDSLTINLDNEILNFRDYYNRYVNNVGDTLFDITDMMRSTVNKYTKDQFNSFIGYKPTLFPKNFAVVQINKHLDDADTVKNIRKLYDQKNKYKSELKDIQASIDNVNELLSSLSFDESDKNRQLYTAQLSDYNSKKIELSNSIAAISQEIAENANNTELPIENAKYHIRGFVDRNIEDLPKIVKIDVEYRYKNKNKYNGNAATIGDNFIFSDWIKMSTFTDMRHPITDGVNYKYEYSVDNTNMNEPSFNQVDIPITQGEVVDFKVKYIYDIGYPFIETTSQWSDILQMDFPEEYLSNIEILDIIEENNNDVKSYQFESILNEKGIPPHVGDSIQDNDLLYFHKPEHIASGFYTPERRIIPLKDKLEDIDGAILDLKDEVYGHSSDNLIVTLSDDVQSINLTPYIDNRFECIDYSSNTNRENIFSDNSVRVENDLKAAYSRLELSIYNAGERNINLYSMFPGPWESEITQASRSKFAPLDYTGANEADNTHTKGIYMLHDDPDIGSKMQTYNQFLYFRMNSVFDGTAYYDDVQNYYGWQGNGDDPNVISNNKNAIPNNWTDPIQSAPNTFMTVFPYVGDYSNICITSTDLFRTIRPGESITVPLSVYYYYNASASQTQASRTISFDLRTSLYSDPLNFRVTIGTSATSTVYSKVKRDYGLSQVNKVPYKSIVVKQVDAQKTALKASSAPNKNRR